MSQTTGSETVVTEKEAGPKIEVAKETQDNLPVAAGKKEVGKVELDIDDAPFLKEEPRPEEKPEDSSASSEPDDAALKKKKKKKLIIIGAAALLLIGGAAAAWFLLSSPPTPPPPPVEEIKPNVIVVPSKPAVHAVPDVIRDFDLFIVPVGANAASTNFLVCKFSTVAKNPAVNTEIDNKMLVLRDAVYFYLRGKTPEYLLDSGNAPEIKKDLTSILNDYLQRGKLEDVLLDNFLAH